MIIGKDKKLLKGVDNLNPLTYNNNVRKRNQNYEKRKQI